MDIGGLRDVAISCAGTFLKNEEDKELLRLTVGIVEQFAVLKKDTLEAITWESAFTALARAMNRKAEEVHDIKKLEGLLKQAKQRLEKLDREGRTFNKEV